MKLEVLDLTCVRGGEHVFDGIGFTLDAGELLVLRGPNGAGKSSLLRLLAGLGRSAGGTIRCDGGDVADDRPGFARRTVYVGHQDALKPSLSVAENLAFWAGLQQGRAAPATRVTGALETLGLGGLSDMPARFLSAGQRRRAALARALASDAELWLLDEPTNALDSTSLTAFESALRSHLSGGGSAIVSSHLAVGGPDSRFLALGDRDAAA